MAIPPPVNNPVPPNMIAQKKPNQFINFVLNHKLATAITVAVIGWFLLFTVSCGQSAKLQTFADAATQMSTQLSGLQANAAAAEVILSATPKVIIVTETPTATPQYTPTITLTPTITPPPTATTDPLKQAFGDGNYLVNVDIAPGVWRNDGTFDDCYWSTNTMSGDIIDNYYGQGGGTMYVAPGAFSVHVEDCGTWTYYAAP